MSISCRGDSKEKVDVWGDMPIGCCRVIIAGAASDDVVRLVVSELFVLDAPTAPPPGRFLPSSHWLKCVVAVVVTELIPSDGTLGEVIENGGSPADDDPTAGATSKKSSSVTRSLLLCCAGGGPSMASPPWMTRCRPPARWWGSDDEDVALCI